MPTVYIHNKPFEVKAGKNLLEACLSLGFDLPYFCWHPALGSVGACRQCAVKLFKDEQDTQGRLVMSCMEPVKEGMRLSITDSTAHAFREQIIEWLMTNHPHDCPVCDEGGSCHLQDMTVMTGHNYRRYQYKKRTYPNQYLGPLIHHEMNRCIQCYRCVRFYRDYAGGDDLNVFAAHHHVYFGREKDGILESPFSGNLAEVCPTGVFTDKTLKEHYTRKWDLTTAPSVCQHCSLGCNIIAGERYGEIRSVVNHFNSEVNGYFLCDKGRYGYEFVNSENRITKSVIRNRTVEAVDETALLAHLESCIVNQKLIGIGSPRASLESNFSLMQLVGKDNFFQGVNEDEAFLERMIVDIMQAGSVHSPSLKDIGLADAILILGEDIWNTAPIMALNVRQSVMKTAATLAAQQIAMPAWQDAAVREKVKEDKGFLANCTLETSPLDEISTNTMRGAPDNIARLGFAIAHLLNSSLPSVTGLDETTQQKASDIATALQKAKQPVIIAGTSCRNDALIRAAFNIAAALNTTERKAGLSYVLPECNSLGLAMMHAPSIERAAGRVKQEQDITAIILENDLYRHFPANKVDTFFSRCKNIIVLDSLHNRTTEKAHTLIPAATFAEADGTMINNEGRAQRFYQVFMPSKPEVKESWKWLWKINSLQKASGNGKEQHPDELLAKLEMAMPQFAGITKVAPGHDFRIHGESVARESHRYSGRTAMTANRAVSEPKPLQDNDSALTYTMEGYQGMPPSNMIPFFWSPGWNSVQSVNKYQQETGGALRGGDPGVRLFEQKAGATVSFFREIPEAFVALQQKWLLLPRYQLFSTGELSGYTKALRELSQPPQISMSKQDATVLGVMNGDAISIKTDDEILTLPLKIDESLCSGIMLAPADRPEVLALNWGNWVTVKIST
jgi:NADH-quinone oxidoreductase subunit G